MKDSDRRIPTIYPRCPACNKPIMDEVLPYFCPKCNYDLNTEAALLILNNEAGEKADKERK